MGQIVQVTKTTGEGEGRNGFVRELECGRVSKVTVVGERLLDAFIARIAAPVRFGWEDGTREDWVSAVDCRLRQERYRDPYVAVDHGDTLLNIQGRAEEAEALGLRWEA